LPEPAPERPLGAGRVLWLVLGTAAVIFALGHFNAFARLQLVLTHGGELETIQPARLAPGCWDETHGDALLTALSEDRPIRHGPGVLVVGNSQQYTVSVARGQKPDPNREVYVAMDLLARRLTADGRTYAFYDGAAPNQTMPEALWQALYWYEIAHISPEFLIVQASFDTFRKSGIRPGYQTLLEDRAYRAALDDFAGGHAGEVFARVWSEAKNDAATRKRELAESGRFSVEGSLRQAMENVNLFRDREKYKAAFLDDIYMLRVSLLHVSPTSRRHITGLPYEENWSALVALVRLARSHGSRVLIYNAPVNPAVSMFYEAEYDSYVQRLVSLAGDDANGFVDLAHAVPAEDWGFWIDGPDPIHFNEQGHQAMADGLYAAFGPTLLSARR
jgi:hypothetical protein